MSYRTLPIVALGFVLFFSTLDLFAQTPAEIFADGFE